MPQFFFYIRLNLVWTKNDTYSIIKRRSRNAIIAKPFKTFCHSRRRKTVFFFSKNIN